jgi:hypothetical protein
MDRPTTDNPQALQLSLIRRLYPPHNETFQAQHMRWALCLLFGSGSHTTRLEVARLSEAQKDAVIAYCEGTDWQPGPGAITEHNIS